MSECALHALVQETSNRTWFYFGVTRVSAGLKLRLTIADFNRQGKLFSQGHEPVTRVQHGPGHKGKWKRGCDNVSYDPGDEFSITWEYTCDEQTTGDTTVFFAFCYPFSYDDIQSQLAALDARWHFSWPATAAVSAGADDAASASGDSDGPAVPPALYYHRELIVRSLDGLRVDLITVR